MIIGFSLDTNILTGSSPKATLLSSNIDIFKKYITTLKRKKHPDELRLLLTEMVIKEVMEHQKNKLNETYKNLEKNYKDMSYSLDGDIPKFVPDKIIKKEETYISKLNTIKIPVSEDLLKKLIIGAIEKKPPFTKNNNKKGDAGFKDAIIWESILNSSEVEECNKFYFFTCDNDFWSEEQYLNTEFKKFHPNTDFKLITIKGESKTQTILKQLIEENNLIENDIFKLYQEDNILQYLIQISSISVVAKPNNGIDELIVIDLTNFSVNNIEIKDVIQDGDHFIVLLRLYNYLDLNVTNPLIVDLKLIIKKTNNTLKYQDYEIIDSCYLGSFITNYMDKFSAISDTLSNMVKLPMKDIKDAFSYNILQNTMKEFACQMNADLKPLRDATQMLNNSLSNIQSEKKIGDLANKK